MTEDEKRQEKTLLLLEYQETADELAHLRSRASRISDALMDISCLLQDAAVREDIRQTPFTRVSVVDIANQRYKEAMDYEKVRQTLSALEVTLNKIVGLSARKGDLHLN